MKNILEEDSSGNILTISVYSMSRKRSTLNIGLRRMTVSREKVRPIGLKGVSGRALNL